jgi:phosphoribosylformylglycinamidine synthase
MAAKGGLGVELDLDRVPARESGMTAYEFLLSESQERMLFVVKAGREEPLMKRFRRWGLQAAVVGQVLEEPIVRVLHHGEVAAEVPATALGRRHTHREARFASRAASRSSGALAMDGSSVA